MSIRSYEINLDSFSSLIPEPIVGRQGDKNGAVTLYVTVTDRGAAVDLTGQTINLMAETANGTAIIADNGGVTITDGVNGRFDYAVPNALWSEAGKITKAYFSLNDNDGQQTTYDLIFIVKESIDISQEEAHNYVTIIDGTIRDLKTKIDEISDAYSSGAFYSRNESDNLFASKEQYGNAIKNTNVVSMGVDNTGSKNVADDIQTIVNSGTYGIYFPAGIYLLDHSIEFPYGTNYPYSIELNANAHIVATSDMDVMFKIGESEVAPDSLPYTPQNKYPELYEVKGGQFHGNLNAKTAVQTSENIKGYKISEMTMDGCLDSYIHLKQSTESFSHDALISDLRIGYVRADEDASKNAIGIQADGGDWQLNNVYIANCKKAVKSAGLVTISNIHVFNGYDANGDIAFQVPGGIMGSEIYIDSYHTGISTLMDSGKYSGTSIMISDLFYYEYTNHDTSSPVHVIDTISDTSININGISSQFSTARKNDGSQVVYIRDTTDSSKTSSISKYLNIRGIDAKSNNDISGSTNIIGDMLYSGANQSLHPFTVTNGMNLPTNTGVIIGYIPDPTDSQSFYAQNFRVSESNGYYVAECYLRIIKGFVNNDKSNGQILVTAGSDRGQLQFGIGPVQTINGKNLHAVYIYNTESQQYLPELTITPMGFSPQGMLFPINSATSAVSIPALLAKTTDNSIGIDYVNDGMDSTKNIVPMNTNLNNQTFSGIYELEGGDVHWSNGPSGLTGGSVWGYLIVRNQGICFQELHVNTDEVFFRSRSGNPASWSSWKKFNTVSG
ncbi:BppU family phage baseplate upper protein [Lactiplantibacillus plantarum]|uniref:BppU family phage baseplate upper protein n=1 Tax=Lactiplantibacillus plantarum TaxID=1590 RepID=UPI0029BC5B74|nr:BppU family phage baseplate upper protein [Lactiplantibacillus plantarum]MDX3785452.1 BppU family phage baseplate upper protein [Lactiplantibacillus plantarum]MDX3811324.1 BppU family phage baseplate upper protein [Lactiplantibacillus plantarum]MDX3856484.1 BppU family phage baseplate upper protein [Lactiplantibacillus plantarum]